MQEWVYFEKFNGTPPAPPLKNAFSPKQRGEGEGPFRLFPWIITSVADCLEREGRICKRCLLTGNNLTVKTQRVKTSENFSEESNFPWRFRRYPDILYSRGASGGCLHGGASLKGEKAHFAAWKKGPENRKNDVKLRPPLCRPLKHSMIYRNLS